jgi:flavorubredoxin
MKALVLYESLFGNTEAVAKAIADGLAPFGEVAIAQVGEAPRALAAEADLVVVGGPTHGHGMSKPASRRQPNATVFATGVWEWLEGLPKAPGRVAAFDTRFDKPRWLTGSAAVHIARRLRRTGYQVVVPPESFFVEHTGGPLCEGEADRARRWGAQLGQRVAAAENLSR